MVAATSLAALIWGVAGVPAPAQTRESDPTTRERAEEMARDAMERLLRALEMLFRSIPQYELPEVTEDGDIIIRRKRLPPPEAPVEPESDTTRT
ncbi:MAG: hypothetical protein D6826_03950 [Alphaproteobacteria bacterium]|nr:MAG: hypothetical protein D6826_03950 [Alphaproteobacteria bacterium]